MLQLQITKDEFESRLIRVLNDLENNKKLIKEIAHELIGNKILEGDVARLFIEPSAVYYQDFRFLTLLTQAIYKHYRKDEINPENIFTKYELEQAKRYVGNVREDKSQILPMKIKNVIRMDSSTFIVKMSIKEINELLTNNILVYDFDLQREATYVKKGDVTVKMPTLNQKAVEEIAEAIENKELFTTTLKYNAQLGTSTVGMELIYDEDDNSLTITEGTKMAIVDGFHRQMGSKLALAKNPELDEPYFSIQITDYPIEKAQKYLGQTAKMNPINKTRVEALLKSRFADETVKYLSENSILKGRISPINTLRKHTKEIVTYDVMSNTIDQEFKLESKFEAIKLGRYLSEFFEILFGVFKKEFADEVEETQTHSLINRNYMFIGYLTIAKEMYESKKELDFEEIEKIINSIDFSLNNNAWSEIGIVRDGKYDEWRMRKKHIKNLKEYFKSIEETLAL